MSKKPKPVERRTISIPPDLDARMSKVDGENWSAIACNAFEARLGQIALQKKEKNMDDVVSRLRASKQENDSALYAEGYELGTDWAKSTASAAQLKRLAKFRESLSHQAQYGWEWQFEEKEGNAFSAADLARTR